MRILQINTDDIAGGAAKVAHNLHTRFNNNCHDSYMLVGNKVVKDDDRIFKKERDKEYKLKRYILKRNLNNLIEKIGLDDFFFI